MFFFHMFLKDNERGCRETVAQRVFTPFCRIQISGVHVPQPLKEVGQNVSATDEIDKHNIIRSSFSVEYF